jgi:multicomponent Na+:H+ antiporter subunit G
MMLVLDIISGALMLIGAAFVLIGSAGLLRLPDALTEIHAAGITDTLGVGLIILGLVVKAGLTLVSVKLLIILLVLVFTNPAASHALARAVIHYQRRPWTDGSKESS